MQELKVIGVERGALLMSADDGEQYRVAVDEVLQARMRQATPDSGAGRKLSPKDIQAQIRAGLGAEDVAALTGADLDYVRRFEGPVLAEREYVIQSALAVHVRSVGEMDPLAPKATFGDVIRGRLLEIGALDERWASWKEQGGGWIVKLTFTADRVEHDARWSYDPKRSALTPGNSEAEALSQLGDLPVPLIPRLRAVTVEDAAPTPAPARFDSDAFNLAGDAIASSASGHAEGRSERRPGETAALLEELRRRRGERDALDFDPPELGGNAPSAAGPESAPVSVIDIPLDAADPGAPVPASSAASARLSSLKGGRKSRATMPSWDDIVFGARPEDE